MKRVVGSLLLLPLTLLSSETKEYDGYSYFSFGMQNIKYEENIVLNNGQHVHSSAHATSPVYISGSLIRVNEKFDFSIDLLSTLLPSETDEHWYLDESFVQQNKFDAIISHMQFLGHYKLNNNHRIVFGPIYSLNSYKRYTFKDQNGNDIVDSDTGAKIGLLEERVANLRLSTGYWYESAPQATPNHMRYRFNALIGQTIWTQASNTGFEKVVFDSINSYELQSSAYAGYTILKGLEIGLFIEYSRQEKTSTDVADDGHTKWPKNTLTLYQGGVSAVWNFSK
ncbi:MAG TPA: hypothetical protein ENK76_04220 [Campylobacterales bacterium]|jgi:hypothetical protein|nr:hypothetical protein [Campylobacterales bacterium]